MLFWLCAFYIKIFDFLFIPKLYIEYKRFTGDKIIMKKEKFKSTFAIIHLSDLHIVSHTNDYSISLHKMIDHIFTVTENISKIIIVFTGDLVEKADFSNSEETIYNFFNDLYSKLGTKIIDIVFTPGNHDKKRGLLMLKTLKNENNEKFWGNFKKNEWAYFANQFDEFLKITHTIRKEIFKLGDTFEGTYGMHITEIDSFKICFLCINSSWLCIDENDEGRLRVGMFQLDDLRSDYQNKKSEINLVIALMHHPTDWLTKDEQKYLNLYMTDEYRLNTNIMLQGHIHERETYNWYNQNHSLTTLVTGMGWDQQKEIKDNGHRYSLYEINMDSSVIRVNTFVSDNTGRFTDDTEVYKDNNIIFPLFVHKYLEMNKLRFNGSEYPLFYPNYNIADNYEDIANGMNKFSINIISIIKDFHYDCLILNEYIAFIKDIIMSSYDDGEIKWSKEFQNIIKNKISRNDKSLLLKKIRKSKDKDFYDIFNSLCTVIDLISKKEEIRSITKMEEILDKICLKQINIDAKDKFYSFIGSICLELQKCIFKKEIFFEESLLRIHFRIVNLMEDDIKYKKLFSYSVIQEKGTKKLKPIEDSELSDISYDGSMIEKSFSLNRSMLFSLNPSSNKHKSENNWIDFLTIAPKNSFNLYKTDDDDTIPYLSFGISVNSFKLQIYLRELSFIGFDKLLSNILSNFFKNIPFDISTLLEEGDKVNEYDEYL